MEEVPEQFGYDLMKESKFGKLYVSPEARDLIEKHYEDHVERSGAGVTSLLIALKTDPFFEVVTRPRKREFYVDLNRNLKVQFADSEVAERFQLDHGKITSYRNLHEMLKDIESDPYFRCKKKDEAYLIDFSAEFIERKNTIMIPESGRTIEKLV